MGLGVAAAGGVWLATGSVAAGVVPMPGVIVSPGAAVITRTVGAAVGLGEEQAARQRERDRRRREKRCMGWRLEAKKWGGEGGWIFSPPPSPLSFLFGPPGAPV